MHQYYVGLDVHSKQSTFVVADGAGTVVAEGEVPTTPAGLKEWGERQALAAGTPVALETGTTAFFVARQLSALGLAPVVVDAHEVRLKAHRPTQKSDRRDAREICEGLRRGIYRVIVHVPRAEVAYLRDTLSRRRHFVRVQTAEINAAKRRLRSAGLGRASRDLRSERGWASVLQVVDPYGDLRANIAQHPAVWRCAGEQIQALEALLAAHQRPFVSDLQRLETLPGVGPIVAATVVAVFADAQRFPDAKHAASYAGAKHGYKRAVVAVAHRLCRIMFAMLRHGRDFDVRKLGIEIGPFEHTTVKLYRLKPAPRRTALRPVPQRA